MGQGSKGDKEKLEAKHLGRLAKILESVVVRMLTKIRVPGSGPNTNLKFTR